MTNVTALATQTPAAMSRGNPFEPDSIPQALQLCDMLAKSALVPSSLRGKPADIFVILATARELGIGPMQALSDINVIQGKPVYSADLMVAQVKRRRDRCEFFILADSTEESATYETKAVGSPKVERYTFTAEDARKLGLLEKDNWKKQRKTMLRRRAAAACAREVYQDLVRGYDPDEAEDFTRTAPVQHAEPARPPAHVEVLPAPDRTLDPGHDPAAMAKTPEVVPPVQTPAVAKIIAGRVNALIHAGHVTSHTFLGEATKILGWHVTGLGKLAVSDMEKIEAHYKPAKDPDADVMSHPLPAVQDYEEEYNPEDDK